MEIRLLDYLDKLGELFRKKEVNDNIKKERFM